MSYVEEIEDDIIFYPEEAPGTFSHSVLWLAKSILNPCLVFSLYGCKKVTAKASSL